MEYLQKALQRIADAFNGSGLVWALGGSYTLALTGLPVQPRDMDLLVNPEDAIQADKLLCGLGQKLPPNPHVKYATKMFGEYRIENADVDLMGGFAIRTDTGTLEYLVNPDEIVWSRDGEKALPLCPPEDWLVLYALMERSEKEEMLYSWLEQKQKINKSILKKWQQKKLPPKVKVLIQNLLETIK
ncbi:MAG: hypothetical protein ACK5JF_03275 [Oscillospiraceae bacterium]